MAIYVLLVGVVGAMNLTQQNLAAGSVFRNQFIAVNLAQEGIELVRNKRDSNFLSCLKLHENDPDPSAYNCNQDNMNNMSTCTVGSPCYLSSDLFSSSDITFAGCDASLPKCHPLTQDINTGKFSYDNNGQFDRKIWIETVAGGRGDVKVSSEVTFPARFGTPSIVLDTILTQWLS